MELFGACLAIAGLISLVGGSVLIFYAGLQLTRATEMYIETKAALTNFSTDSNDKHDQIQNWILETNIAIEASETKSANVREFCASRYLDMEKRIQEVEKTFADMNTTPNMMN